jgi:PhnB protein
MLIVTPTLNFKGECEEAIGMYQKAFGARVGCLLHYSDAIKEDWDNPLTDEQANYVYHAEIYIGEQRIMMSDMIDVDLVKGTSSFLTVTFEDANQVKEAYEILKDGCTIIYPMHSTTYSSCMVVLIDKYGFRWGLMTEQTEK